MGVVFGAKTARNQVGHASFRNIGTTLLQISAGGATYSVAVDATFTVAAADAQASADVTRYLASGQLQQLTVYGAIAPGTPIATGGSQSIAQAPPSFTAATVSSITGNFDGVGIDQISGRWVLSNGNRLIYPNSRVRQQPAAGPTSAITLGATFQRTSMDGALGFSLYTDAGTTDQSFANGVVVLFEPTGLVEIFRVQGGLWNAIVDRASQVPYPLDLNEHTFSIVTTYPDSGHLRFLVYADGIVVATATITSGIITNGTIGFATAGGAAPVLIVPGSFVFDLGTDIYETTSAVTRQVIGNQNGTASLAIPSQVTGVLGQSNTDPAVVAGSVTGTNRNMVPDSDYKFGQTYCNTNQAGAMTLQLGVGGSGGKGVVLSSAAGGLAGTAYFKFYAIGPVTQGQQWTVSGNIKATDTLSGGTGLPAWEVWDGSFTTRVAHADQQIGLPVAATDHSRRVQQTFFVPAGVTSLIVTPASNNVEIKAGGSIVWSEPKLETGPYATAYSTGLFDDAHQTLPLQIQAGELQSIVTPDGLGGGMVKLGTADPASPAPFIVMPGQVGSTLSQSANAQNTFLKGQTVAGLSVLPGAITNAATSSSIYTNTPANTYAGLSNNFYWYLAGVGPITNTTIIPDGATLIYTVSQTDPAAAPAATLEQLQIAPFATITAVWNHPTFVGTSIGSTLVNFTGNTASTTASIAANASLADTSSPNITGVQQQVTTTPQYTAGLTNSGNPSISQGSVSQTTPTARTKAVNDSETTGINAAGNTVTSNQQFTAAVNQSSSPQVQQVSNTSTAPGQKTTAGSISSTPTITSSTGSSSTTTAKTGAVNGNSSTSTITTNGTPFSNTTQQSGSTATYTGTASVTQNSSTSYANQQKYGTSTNGSGSPQINTTSNTTTTLTQHTSGYLNNANNTAHASTASIVGSAAYTANSTSASGGIGVGVYTDTKNTSSNAGCSSDTYSFQGTPNASLPSLQILTGANAYCDGSNAMSLSFTLPSTFSVSVGISGQQERSRIYPSTGETVYLCYNTNTMRTDTYGITWTVTLLNPGGAQVQQWPGITGSQTLSTSAGGGAQGQYKWIVQPQYNTDPGGSTVPDGSVTVNTGVCTASWNDRSVSYADNAGSFALYGQYSSNVAPTSRATALQFHCSTTAWSSDTYGAAEVEIVIQKADGSGTWVTTLDTSGNPNGSPSTSPLVTAGYDYYYWNASETCTSWYVWMRAVIVTDNHNLGIGTQNYYPNIDGYFYYYNNDSSTTYSYTTTNGATTSLPTSSVALGGTASAPISLVLSGVVLPSDTYGGTSLYVQLVDPNGTIQYSTTATNNGTLNYTGGGVNGTWTWKVTPQVSRTGNPTTNASYNVTFTAQAEWYESVGTTTYTYSTADGAEATYNSSATTQAPINAGTQIGLTISGVTCPSDAAGSSYYLVTLKDPSGNVLTYSYNASYNSTTGTSNGNVSFAGATTFTYSAAGAVTGTYTWTVKAHSISANTGSGSYTVTLSATPTWYATTSGTNYTYTPASGASTNYATGAATLAPTSSTTQLSVTLSGIVTPSDATGHGQYSVSLKNPAGTVVGTWSVPYGQTSFTQTYWAASTAAGVWTWVVQATAVSSGSGTVNGSYTCTANVQAGWYETVTATTTTYTSNNGTTTNFVTTAATLGPSSAALQLGLNITAMTAGSDSYGSSQWQISLTRPDGTQAKLWNITTAQNLTFWETSAQAGVWTWHLTGTCTNNSTGTSLYSDSLTATESWYENVTTTTTTYQTTAGATTTVKTDPTTVAPTAPSTQLTFTMSSLVATSDANGSSSWTVTLIDPGSNVVRTWTGLVTAQTLTWSNATAVSGQYTWQFQAVAVKATSPAATSTYSDTIAGTLGWYQSVTTTTTNYTVAPGTASNWQTDANTMAPVDMAHQLTLTFTGLTLPSSAAGSSEYLVTLLDPSSVQVGSWVVTALGQSPLSYSASAAVGGVYTWSIQATSIKSASPAQVSWTTSLTGNIGWYYPVTSSATRYINNASTSTSSAQTDPSTIAPTTSALALALTPSAVTLPSSGAGATQYQVTLKDPTGTAVLTQTITDTTPISWWQAGAKPGQYTWTIYATCTNTGTSTATYATAFSGTIGWHQSLTQAQNVYTSHDGAAARYSTPANTVAPTAVGAQLSLVLSQVSAPANTYGSSSVAVMLYDPNNSVVASMTTTGIVGPTTLNYYNASAIAGTYTWVVFAQCVTNQTGSSSYSVSWGGQYSWYQPSASSQGVTVLAADGITARNAVSDSNVKFVSLTPSMAAFNITNSANTALGFSLGILSKGF